MLIIRFTNQHALIILTMKLDIIIPCYNAASTLNRAVESSLQQAELHQLWLVDDASTDDTWAHIQAWQARYPSRIQACRLPDNGGVARARNWGALQSQAEIIGFLDADDAYQAHALQAALYCFEQLDYLGLIRLRLQAVGLDSRYANHPNIAQAWHSLQMTVGGNTVFRRAFFLACGGFPQDALFRELGGEDGALGIATTQSSVVGTLFANSEPAVLHYCRAGMHAERLLDAYLFQQHDSRVTPENYAQAQAVTSQIHQQLQQLRPILNQAKNGSMPLTVSRAE